MISQKKARIQTEISQGAEYEGVLLKLKPFFEGKEDDLLEAFKSTPANDLETMRILNLHLKALNSLFNDICGYINTGKLAQHELRTIE